MPASIFQFERKLGFWTTLMMITYLAELSSQVAVQWMVWNWVSFLCSWVGFLTVSFQPIDWKIHHPKSFFCQILIGNFLSSIHCVLYNNFQSVFNCKCPIKFVSFESWLMNLCLDRGKACDIENRPWLWLFVIYYHSDNFYWHSNNKLTIS